ncbi:hypothetical protein YA0001_13660 [Pseudomonas viridiflava]|uniref:hypothetical protein n=1 Tax=Pseudomonas viridiflava TaxID=33069 RepID=UPI0018E61413|nr:hypothetical protein [Pseudomonas viridiflava]MBI6578184.1 hypothetical protein [Pseudomonas viridiflava]MBI6610750.1 hypothetical protein [Pseudomonas viridiflava]MBI6637004.1 hypothetical protein [Pseudomonas viridiflava]MBI6868622.1 hypothetical protein [Pseudomonas viridiflava]
MGRLVKGETALGVKVLSEAAMHSVRRRAEIFEHLKADHSARSVTLKCFTSIQLLAEWCDVEMGISPISVKTLRKHMSSFYPEGLAAMCKAARCLSREGRQNHSDGDGFNYKRQTERAIDSALEMTVRYLDLLERFKKISQKDNDSIKELEQHFRKFGRNPHIQEVC